MYYYYENLQLLLNLVHFSSVAMWPAMWSMKESKTNPEQEAREEVDDCGIENEREVQMMIKNFNECNE